MEDKLIMSKKELERKTLLEGYICKKLTLLDVSERMKVSYRQAKRIWKKYKEEGDNGLQHGNRGKRAKNAYPKGFKDTILNLYQKKYFEFWPTFAAEKMLEDDRIVVHSETLRLWLKKKKSYGIGKGSIKYSANVVKEGLVLVIYCKLTVQFIAGFQATKSIIASSIWLMKCI